MLYLAATGSSLRGAHPWVGVMIGPRTRSLGGILEGPPWASVNDSYTGRFDPVAFETHLRRLLVHRSTCLFAAVPNRPGDAQVALTLWPRWSNIIRSFGFPVAYIAQDGAEKHKLPEDADALFLAGSDAWREECGSALISVALDRNLRVHVGRVNSERRVRRLASLGVSSVNGTHLAFKGLAKGLDDVER